MIAAAIGPVFTFLDDALKRAAGDDDPVVRNAVGRALRGGGEVRS